MENNEIIQTILSLLQESGRKQKELTDFLGITQNAFTDWKSGRIKSYTKHLPRIAEFFGVSVDYLVGNTTQKEPVLYISPNVANKIKNLAKARGIVLKDMLSDLQMGSNTFSHMLHGKAVAFDTLARIADYLDCSVDYLLDRAEAPDMRKTDKKEKPVTEDELSEEVVIYHRDGKRVVKRFTKEQMELIAQMLDGIPEKK